MKAESVDEASQFRYPCYVSEKLDGWRCLIVDGVMFTSGGKPFKPPVQKRFKPVIEAAHKAKWLISSFYPGQQKGGWVGFSGFVRTLFRVRRSVYDAV